MGWAGLGVIGLALGGRRCLGVERSRRVGSLNVDEVMNRKRFTCLFSISHAMDCIPALLKLVSNPKRPRKTYSTESTHVLSCATLKCFENDAKSQLKK